MPSSSKELPEEQHSKSSILTYLERIAFSVGLAVVVGGAVTVTSVGISLLILRVSGFAGSGLNGLLASVLCIVVFWWKGNSGHRLAGLLITMALFFCMLITSTIFASSCNDLSWDGMVYHSGNLDILRQGWNPIWEPDKYSYNATSYYPRVSYYLTLSAWALIGDMEAAKLFFPLLVMATFCILWSYLSWAGATSTVAVALAMVAVLNPVVVSQVLTKMVDGQFYILLLLFLLASADLLVASRRISLALLFPTLVLLCNVKFTGLVFASALALPVLAYWTYTRQVSKIAYMLFCFIFAISITGFSPYLTNAFVHQNPFHKVVGPDKIEIEENQAKSGQVMMDFVNRGRPYKLFWSAVSLPEIRTPAEPHLATPFSITRQHLGMYWRPDLRVGGFGPLFGLSLLLSLTLSMAALPFLLRPILLAWSLAALVLLTAMLISPCWWARLVPQVWLVPIIITLPLVLASHSRKYDPFLRYCAVILLGVLALNAGLVAVFALARTHRMSAEIDAVLNRAAATASDLNPLLLETNRHLGVLFRLEGRGIPTEVVPEPPKAGFTPLKVPFSRAVLWLPEGT